MVDWWNENNLQKIVVNNFTEMIWMVEWTVRSRAEHWTMDFLALEKEAKIDFSSISI